MQPMAIRSNHYDAAFEEFLRSRCVPYVAVDERRRALLQESSIKSFDFIVEADRENLLVDVKGRLWGGTPSGGNNSADGSRHRRRWENWATEDDVASLLRWEQVFGSSFEAMFVFAYAIEPGVEQPPLDEREGASLFHYNGRHYFFTAFRVQEYASYMKPRSAGWGTVTVPAADYRSLRQPFEGFLQTNSVAG